MVLEDEELEEFQLPEKPFIVSGAPNDASFEERRNQSQRFLLNPRKDLPIVLDFAKY